MMSTAAAGTSLEQAASGRSGTVVRPNRRVARPSKPSIAGRPGDPRRTSPRRPAEPSKVEPLLKWPGGKRNLLPQLQQLMPADVHPGFDGRLVEPFLGGASMFLHLQPREAILSDANADLVNFYTQVRDHLDDLLPILDAMAKRPYTDEVYYEMRASNPRSRLRRAARFLYLSKYGFNGLYRVNRKGQFNVSFGRTASGKRPNLYSQDNILAVSALLQRAELYTSPFEKTLKLAGPRDFVFLDPPYEPISATASFTGYTKDGFDLSDQARLRDRVLDLDVRTRSEARVMLSNSIAPQLLALYDGKPGINQHRVIAGRAISAKASGRGGTPEVVITNYPAGERRAA